MTHLNVSTFGQIVTVMITEMDTGSFPSILEDAKRRTDRPFICASWSTLLKANQRVGRRDGSCGRHLLYDCHATGPVQCCETSLATLRRRAIP